LAELGVVNFQGAEEVRFCGFQVPGSLGEESQIVCDRGDVELERRLAALKKVDGELPISPCVLAAADGVMGGSEAGVEAADLVEAVWPIFQLVDGLSVVLAGELVVSKFPVDVGADFKSRGKCVDAIEVRGEALLAFLHGGAGGVEGFIQVSGGAESLHAVLEDANEGSGW
jgi:hypothetical protein